MRRNCIELDPCRFELDACRFEIDPCRFELDPCRFELDPCRFELEACRFELDPCRFELDPCRFELDPRRFELRTAPGIEARIVAARRQLKWGAKKLRVYLQAHQPTDAWPAVLKAPSRCKGGCRTSVKKVPGLNRPGFFGGLIP